MPHPEGKGAGWSWMTKLSAEVEADSPEEPKGPQAKVLTVSDSVADGTREDRSGQALVSLLQTSGFDVVETSVVPDGIVSVAAALSGMARGFAGVVVSTGGTGFAPRDQTPEATREVIDR